MMTAPTKPWNYDEYFLAQQKKIKESKEAK